MKRKKQQKQKQQKRLQLKKTLNKPVCVGAIAGAHGVKGDFKVKSFTAVPADVTAYGEVLVEGGNGLALDLKLVREAKPGLFITRAVQVTTREQAEGLRGSKLYVDRSVLPPPEEDEFYYEDLIGLKAQTREGASFGKVKAVVNYGAGDLLELFQIPEVKGTRLLAFTRELVPEIRFDEGIIIVALPADFLETPKQPAQEQGK